MAAHPLLYGYDPHQNGRWELWIDRDEEGHLVDATRYDWKQGNDLLMLYPNLRNPT